MADFKKNKDRFFPKKQCVMIFFGKRLVMENVEKIVFCQENRIVLRGSENVEILGNQLVLRELGNDNMEVVGKIRAIRLGEENS